VKITIICHSSTGNTRLCAEAMAAELGRLGHECVTIDVRRLGRGEMPDDLKTADLVGVATPTYFFRPPVNLTEYLQSIPPLEPKPGFVLNTCSAVRSNTVKTIAKLLQRRNVFMIGRLTIHAEEAYPLFRFGFFKYNEGKPHEKDLEKVRRFARRIDERAKKIQSDESERRRALRKRLYVNLPTPFHLIALVSTRKNQLRAMLRKKVIADRCTSCGVCVEACPTHSIALVPFTRDKVETSPGVVIEEKEQYERKLAEAAAFGCSCTSGPHNFGSDARGQEVRKEKTPQGGATLTLPKFADTCMACYACYNLCPEDAIITSLCRGRPRYRGPKLSPEGV